MSRKDNEMMLSDAEKRVYDWIVRGLSNQEIGDKLFVDISTINFHLGRIYKKLKVKNKIGLILYHYNVRKGEDFGTIHIVGENLSFDLQERF